MYIPIIFWGSYYLRWLWQETSKGQELQIPVKGYGHAVQGYALKFLQYNKSTNQFVQPKLATTPDGISSLQKMDMSWKDQLTEVWANSK